jgi:hypothetical protein
MREQESSPQSEDQTRAAQQITARLESLGIELDGSESAERLGEIADAVERFEDAVELRGGDLMVDEPPRGEEGQPDDPDFVLPKRAADETVSAYLDRLEAATQRVLARPELDASEEIDEDGLS